MEKNRFAEMTDEELRVEKKKLKNSKILHALGIGFLASVLIYGIVAWSLSPEKRLGFFIPMLFPIFMIYKMLKSPNVNQDLETVLKERQLD